MEYPNNQNIQKKKKEKKKKRKEKLKERQKQQQYFVALWLIGKVLKGKSALLFSRSRFNRKKEVQLHFWRKVRSGIVYSILG